MSLSALSLVAAAAVSVAAVAHTTTVEAATLALLNAVGSWRLSGGTLIGGRGKILELVGWINLASATVALLAIHLRRRRRGGTRLTTCEGKDATTEAPRSDGEHWGGRGRRRGGRDGDGIAVGSMLVPLFVAAAALTASSPASSAADGVVAESCDAAAYADDSSSEDVSCIVGSSPQHSRYGAVGGCGPPVVSEWYTLASSLAGLYFATSNLLSCIVALGVASWFNSSERRWRLFDVLRSYRSSLSPARREALFYVSALVLAHRRLPNDRLGGDDAERCWMIPFLVLAFKCASTALFHPGDVSTVRDGADADDEGGNLGDDHRSTECNGHQAASEANSPPSSETVAAASVRNGTSSSVGGSGKGHGEGNGTTSPATTMARDEGNGHVGAVMTRAEGPGCPSSKPTPTATAEEGGSSSSRRGAANALPVTPGEYAAVSTLVSIGLADYVLRYLIPRHSRWWFGGRPLGLGTVDPMVTHLAAAHGGMVGCILGCVASEIAVRRLFFDGGPAPASRWMGNPHIRKQLHRRPRPTRVDGTTTTTNNGVDGDGEDGVRPRGIRPDGPRGRSTFVGCAVRFVVLAAVAFACVDVALRKSIATRLYPSPWPKPLSSLPGALSIRWIGAFLSTPEGGDELDVLMGIVAAPPVDVGEGGNSGVVEDPITEAATAGRCPGRDGGDGVGMKSSWSGSATNTSRRSLAEGEGGDWWSRGLKGEGRGAVMVVRRGSWLSYWAAVLVAAAPLAAWLAVRQLRRRRRRHRSSSVATDDRESRPGTVGGDAPRNILVPSSARGEVVVARKYFHLVAVALFAPATSSAPSVMSLSYAVALALLIVVESFRLSSAMGGMGAYRVDVENVAGGNNDDDDDYCKRRDSRLSGAAAGETPSITDAAASGAGDDGNTSLRTRDGMDLNGAHTSNGLGDEASKDHHPANNGALPGSNGHHKGDEKNDHNGQDRDASDNQCVSSADRTAAGDYTETKTTRPLASLNDFYLAFLDDKDAPAGDHGAVVVTHAALIVGCAVPLWTSAVLFDDGDFSSRSSSLLRELLPYVGIVVLGVGDAFGAVLGTYLGRHRWPGTRRTVEGSLAMLLSMVAFTVVLFGRTTSGAAPGWFRVLVVMVVTTVLEASTSQIDNFCLPLAGTALVLILLGDDGLG